MKKKMRRLVDYSALLNSIDKGIYAKISIFFFDRYGRSSSKGDVLIPDEPGR